MTAAAGFSYSETSCVFFYEKQRNHVLCLSEELHLISLWCTGQGSHYQLFQGWLFYQQWLRNIILVCFSDLVSFLVEALQQFLSTYLPKKQHKDLLQTGDENISVKQRTTASQSTLLKKGK